MIFSMTLQQRKILKKKKEAGKNSFFAKQLQVQSNQF